MASRTVSGGVPVGVGWLLGFALGLVTGLVAWLVSGEVSLGLILFVATGTALGFKVEQTLDGRPLTPREQRLARLAVVAGLVVGATVLGYVLLFA
jgi:hypothetical protein